MFSFAALSQSKMNIPGEIHQSDSNTNKVEIENSPNTDFNYNPGGWAIEPRPDQIITNQPSNSILNRSNNIISSGLEVLSKLNYIIVNQQTELIYGINGCQTKNQYKVLNPHGLLLFDAIENFNCCTRFCCGSNRPFGMEICQPNGDEIIQLEQPLRCSSCFCPCCLQEMEVYSPPGKWRIMSIRHHQIKFIQVQN